MAETHGSPNPADKLPAFNPANMTMATFLNDIEIGIEDALERTAGMHPSTPKLQSFISAREQLRFLQ